MHAAQYRKVCTMQILTQFAGFSPCQLPPAVRKFHFWLRVMFFVSSAILIYRAEQERKIREAQYAADMKAFEEKLKRESQADDDRWDDMMASIYRGLNSILSYADLPQIGDGDESL